MFSSKLGYSELVLLWTPYFLQTLQTFFVLCYPQVPRQQISRGRRRGSQRCVGVGGSSPGVNAVPLRLRMEMLWKELFSEYSMALFVSSSSSSSSSYPSPLRQNSDQHDEMVRQKSFMGFEGIMCKFVSWVCLGCVSDKNIMVRQINFRG